jgi:hypothetical protein
MHTSTVLPADADSDVGDSHRLTSTKNRRNCFCRNYFCRPFDGCFSDCFRRGIVGSQVPDGNASTPRDFGPIVVVEFHSVQAIL